MPYFIYFTTFYAFVKFLQIYKGKKKLIKQMTNFFFLLREKEFPLLANNYWFGGIRISSTLTPRAFATLYTLYGLAFPLATLRTVDGDIPFSSANRFRVVPLNRQRVLRSYFALLISVGFASSFATVTSKAPAMRAIVSYLVVTVPLKIVLSVSLEISAFSQSSL